MLNVKNEDYVESSTNNSGLLKFHFRNDNVTNKSAFISQREFSIGSQT